MRTDKNNDKNKTNLPPLPFRSSSRFLNSRRTTKPINSKFSDCQFVFINCFVKIKCNFMSGSFCIVKLLDVSRKTTFYFIFMDFNPHQTKMK